MSEFTHRQPGLIGFFALKRARNREMPIAAALHHRPRQARIPPRIPPRIPLRIPLRIPPRIPPRIPLRIPRAARPRQVPGPRRSSELRPPGATAGGEGGLVQTGGPAHSRRRPPAVRVEKGGRRKARLQGNKVFKRRGQRSERRAAPRPPAETAAT
ncbi:uncharacterized protein LOC143693327 [Agelaius phoeniceus]|uniref:uncharacterized protein LOC143693327 n=1 Tax=Agelaius phoeniceus TaxID=39638 RepID=UPI004054ED87